MKQYILVTLAVLAGRYMDVPLWQRVLTATWAAWVLRQLDELKQEKPS